MPALTPTRMYVSPEGEARAVYVTTKEYTLQALLKYACWVRTDYARNNKGDRLDMWQDGAWETWEDQFNSARTGQLRQIGRVSETTPGMVSPTYRMVDGKMVQFSEEIVPDQVRMVSNYELDVPADLISQADADFAALAQMSSSEAPVLRGIDARGLVTGDYIVDNRTPAKSHVYRIRREGSKVFRERFIDSSTFRGRRMIEGGQKSVEFAEFTPAKVAEDPSGVLTRMCAALNLPVVQNARIYLAETYGESYGLMGRIGQEKREKTIVDPWEASLTPYELAEVAKAQDLPPGDLWLGTLSKRYDLSTGAVSLALNHVAKSAGLDASFRKTYGSNIHAEGKDVGKLVSGGSSFSSYMDYVPEYDPYADYSPGHGAQISAKYVAAFIPAAILAEHQLAARGGYRLKPNPLAHKLYLDLAASNPPGTPTTKRDDVKHTEGKSGEHEASWTSSTFGQVEVISGASGQRDVWHNIKTSRPKTRYGYSAEAKRWARGNVPPTELLDEVRAHGWAALFGLAYAPETLKVPSVIPSAPEPSRVPEALKVPSIVPVTSPEPRVEALPVAPATPPSRFRKADRQVGAFADLSLTDKIYSMAMQGSDWHLPGDPYGLLLKDASEEEIFTSLCGYLGAPAAAVDQVLAQMSGVTRAELVSAVAYRERSAIKLVLPDELVDWLNRTALPEAMYKIPETLVTALQRTCSPDVRYADMAYYSRKEYPYGSPGFLLLSRPEYIADVTLTAEAVRWEHEYEKNAPRGYQGGAEGVVQADALLTLLRQEGDVTGWWGSPEHRQIVQLSTVAWVRWVFNRFFGGVSTRVATASPEYLLYFPWDKYPALLAPVEWLRSDTTARVAHLKAAGFHGGQYFRWLTELEYTGPVSEDRVTTEFKRLSDFGRYGDNPWVIEHTATTVTLTCDLFTSRFSHTLKVGGGKRAQLLALATSFEVRDAWMHARYTPRADDYFVKQIERKIHALSEVFGPMNDAPAAVPTVTFVQQNGQLQVNLTNRGKTQKLFWVDEMIPGKRHGYYLGDGGKVRMVELARFTEEAVYASPEIFVTALKKMGLTVPVGTVLSGPQGRTIYLPLDAKSTPPSVTPPQAPPRFVQYTPPPAPPLRALGPYELLPQRGEHGTVKFNGIDYGVVFQGGAVAVLPTGDKLDIPNLPAPEEKPYVIDDVKVARYRPGDVVRVVSDYVVDKKDYRLVAPQDGEYGEVYSLRYVSGQIQYTVWLRSLETGRRTVLRHLPAGELAPWEGLRLDPPPGIVANIQAFQRFCGLSAPGTIEWSSTALAFAVEMWDRGERDRLDLLDVQTLPELMYYPDDDIVSARTFPLPVTFPRVVVARESNQDGRSFLSIFDWTQHTAVAEGIYWAMQQLAPRMSVPHDHPAWLLACGMIPVISEEWSGLSESVRKGFTVDARCAKTHGWLTAKTIVTSAESSAQLDQVAAQARSALTSGGYIGTFTWFTEFLAGVKYTEPHLAVSVDQALVDLYSMAGDPKPGVPPKLTPQMVLQTIRTIQEQRKISDPVITDVYHVALSAYNRTLRLSDFYEALDRWENHQGLSNVIGELPLNFRPSLSSQQMTHYLFQILRSVSPRARHPQTTTSSEAQVGMYQVVVVDDRKMSRRSISTPLPYDRAVVLARKAQELHPHEQYPWIRMTLAPVPETISRDALSNPPADHLVHHFTASDGTVWPEPQGLTAEETRKVIRHRAQEAGWTDDPLAGGEFIYYPSGWFLHSPSPNV